MTVSCFNVKIAMCHLPISPHSQKAATSSIFSLLIPLWPITQCSAGQVKFSKELLGYSYGKMIPLHLRFGPHSRKVLLLWWDVGRGVRNGINGRLGTELFFSDYWISIVLSFFLIPRLFQRWTLKKASRTLLMNDMMMWWEIEEERRKSSVRLPAENLSTLCHGSLINLCLSYWKAASAVQIYLQCEPYFRQLALPEHNLYILVHHFSKLL